MVCHFCPHAKYGEIIVGENSFTRRKGFISRELFDYLVSECELVGKGLLFGFFGEPMMHPAFNELLTSIPSSRSYPVTLNTNWSLASENRMPGLLSVDHVRISLDTLNPERYEKLCPGTPVVDWKNQKSTSRHRTILDKLLYWLDLEDRPETSIVHVMSDYNRDETQEFIDYLKPKLKPNDFILCKSVLSYGGCMPEGTMTEQEHCHIKDEPFLTVSWDGYTSPCNLDVDVTIGKIPINSFPSVEMLLASDEWKDALESIKTTSPTCANCKDCNNWTRNEKHFLTHTEYHESSPSAPLQIRAKSTIKKLIKKISA